MNYKSYVITLSVNQKSMQFGNRCIESGKKFNIKIDHFDAITPRHKPLFLLEKKNIKISKLVDRAITRNSYIHEQAGCFITHYTLWEKCVRDNTVYLIFEHDAVVDKPIPDNIIDGSGFNLIVNIGKPSHGKIYKPKHTGVGPLSVSRFKGTHSYALKPAGAEQLIKIAKNKGADAADTFLNITTFPFLQELYPWPVIARPEFTTMHPITHKYTHGCCIDEFGNLR